MAKANYMVLKTPTGEQDNQGNPGFQFFSDEITAIV